jgi:Uma2 family endonuclease
MASFPERRVHWTEAEYLAFENASLTKHEYLDGEIFAMAGARPEHNLVATACVSTLHPLVRGRGCRAFNSDQRVYVPATGLYTYADGGVFCGQMTLHSDGMCLLNPVLLFEVLSPATRDYDLGAKREHYRRIPSLRHILLIDQPERMIWHDCRSGGNWRSLTVTQGSIDLTDLGGALDLDELYLPIPPGP